MPAKGANGLGRFSVAFEVANYADLIRAQDGTSPPDQVRRETIQGLVDSGATKLVLPQAVVKRLGLPPGDPILVRYADRQRARRGGQRVLPQTPRTRWDLLRHRRAETENRPARRDRAGRSRPARGLHGPAGGSPWSQRCDRWDRM